MKIPSLLPGGLPLLLAAVFAFVPVAPVSAADSVVVFNEINYHPPTATGTEWIELRNLMGVNVDLSGWRVSGGVEFIFPTGTVIPGHGLLIVAADPAHATLSGKGALGPFTGSLNNAGETLRLRNNSNRVMDDLTYSDGGDWPVGADGSGATLTKRDQGSADPQPGNWTASPQPGGTPGAWNFPLPGQPPTATTLVALTDSWKYRADPAAPPAGWTGITYDDTAWTAGAAALYAGNPQVSGAGEGLIAWWPLNETTGTTAANAVAGGPAGTLVNGPLWINDATRGRVLSLAGATDYVSTGTALIPAMTLSNSFSWSFWANSNDGAGSSVVLGNRYSPSGADWNPREFIKFTPGQLEFHRDGAGQNIDYPDFPTGGWVHHALVKSGAVLTYYRNGTASGSVSISQGTNNPQPFYFGGDQANENWSGRLDEVALWTKALPAASVAGLASGTYTPATAPTNPNGGGNLATQIAGGTPAHYFRKSFTFSGNPARASLTLRHLVKDGAVFYLNGSEITRFNMPGGAVTHATPASAEPANAVLAPAVTVPGTALQAGLNVLAVEVHQSSAVNQDMVFAAALEVLEEPATAEGPSAVVFNEIASALDSNFRVELTNTSAAAVNLGGWVLRSSSGASSNLPAQSLTPGGFLVMDTALLGFTPVAGDKLFLFRSGDGALTDARSVTNRLRGRSGESWIYPAAATFGAANTFALHTGIVFNEIMYNPWALDAVPGTPASVQTTTLVDWNGTWRYHLSGGDLGNTWEMAAHSVGGAWQSGGGPFGYETTAGVPAHPISTVFPSPVANNPFVMTYYFETEFTLTAQQIANFTELRITHEVDDGAIFYLNGQPVSRHAMPDEPVTAATPSNGSGEAVTIGPVTLSEAKALLVPGLNRLSVEVHQVNTTSSDIVFGMKLDGVGVQTPAVPGLPLRNSDEQWIELHNRSAAPVDLAGWALTDGVDFVFPANTLLAAGGYLVVARDAASLATKHPSIQIAGQFSGSLSRSGERLQLTDATGNPADEVRYVDGGRWPGKADGEGSSLELRDPRADRRIPEAWAASDDSPRRRWRTYTYSAPATNGQGDPTLYNEFILGLLDSGEVLLDDLSVIESPAGAARQLIQNGNFSGGTASFWRFLGTHRHAAVIDDPDSPGNKVLHLRSSGASEHMHNHVETTLKNAGSFVTINSSLTYQISFRAKWLSGSNQLNTRLYFNRAARTTALEAQPDGGTPGAVNSMHLANAGPDLNGLTHAPAVPAAGQPATVSVTAADPDGASALTLFYSVGGAAFTAVPMPALGGGRYAGTVPAQAAAARVQFYVSALDTAGAVALLPAKGTASRAMIPWADGQANLDYGTVRPNNFRIVMPQADADFMHTNTQLMSNDRLGCTVIYNEQDIYYDCGVRLKGSQRGRPKDVRVGFTVGFPADHLFLGAHGTVAVDRSGSGDQFSQKEILVKHAAARAGRIPGMNDDLIRVIAPKSAHTGSAILLKSRFDIEWLENQIENGGDGRMFEYELIYYPTTTTGGVEGLKVPDPDNVAGVNVRTLGGLDKELYRWHWLIDNNRDADDYSRLINMLQTFGLTGAAYRTALPEAIDVDQWLRAFAIQTLFGIGDSYSSGSQHNLLLYFRPGDGRGMYFPWDMDFTFNLGTTAGVVNNGDLGNILAASPEYFRGYYGHLHELITTVFNSTYMSPWAAHYSLFLPSENLTGYVPYIDSRRSHVLALINAAVPSVPYAITTPAGTSTPQTSLQIQGNGWVNVAEIRLVSTGAALPITWTGNTVWRVTVPVVPGANTIVLAAYDASGGLLGTSSVTVNGTGTTVPAAANNLAVSEIMYHPPGPTAAEQAAGFGDGEEFEFIELVNLSPTLTVDLAGAGFTTGIVALLPSSTLAPGARLVIARNPAAFAARYGTGIAAVSGFGTSASPALANSGERLVLNAAGGAVIADFSYLDSLPWPPDADGAGYSLTRMRPGTGDSSSAASWRTSAASGGTPGAGDVIGLSNWLAGYGITLADASPDQDELSALLEYAAGRSPVVADGPDPFSGGFAQDSGDFFPIADFVQRIGTDDVVLSGEASADLGVWTDQSTGDVIYLGRLNNGDGTETVRFRSAVPASGLRRFLRIRGTVPP